MNGLEKIGIDIIRIFIAKNKFGNRGTWTGKIHIETVLIAVERHHSQLIRIIREDNSRNVTSIFQRHVHGTDGFCSDIEHSTFHSWVFFSRFGVFVCIKIGIQLFIKRLKTILRNFRFVGTHVSQKFVVGRKLH